MSTEAGKTAAFHIIQQQIDSAIAAPKCHRCGCLQRTVEALAGTAEGQNELSDALHRARQVFVPKEYDCLGCPVCYPAIAANAFVEAHPEAGAKLDLCPWSPSAPVSKPSTSIAGGSSISLGCTER